LSKSGSALFNVGDDFKVKCSFAHLLNVLLNFTEYAARFAKAEHRKYLAVTESMVFTPLIELSALYSGLYM